jgi:hypothetical protein
MNTNGSDVETGRSRSVRDQRWDACYVSPTAISLSLGQSPPCRTGVANPDPRTEC